MPWTWVFHGCLSVVQIDSHHCHHLPQSLPQSVSNTLAISTLTQCLNVFCSDFSIVHILQRSDFAILFAEEHCRCAADLWRGQVHTAGNASCQRMIVLVWAVFGSTQFGKHHMLHVVVIQDYHKTFVLWNLCSCDSTLHLFSLYFLIFFNVSMFIYYLFFRYAFVFSLLISQSKFVQTMWPTDEINWWRNWPWIYLWSHTKGRKEANWNCEGC